jgi:uncharacterized protein with GYD domain
VARYVVLYNFTAEGVKGIRESVKRAGRIRQDNARVGFKIIDVFWTQGSYDMMAIVEAPSEEAMMGAMMNVVSAGNVTSTTMRAFDALEMSRILAQTLPLHDDRNEAPPADAKPAPKRAAPKKK